MNFETRQEWAGEGTHLWRASLILELSGAQLIEGKGNHRGNVTCFLSQLLHEN